jgi:hypothetical protein
VRVESSICRSVRVAPPGSAITLMFEFDNVPRNFASFETTEVIYRYLGCAPELGRAPENESNVDLRHSRIAGSCECGSARQKMNERPTRH